MIPSHISREPVGRLTESLGLEPVLECGHGCRRRRSVWPIMMSLLRDVNRVYREAKRFDGYGMEPYTRYEE